MSEENKTVELKDNELKKVSGGIANTMIVGKTLVHNACFASGSVISVYEGNDVTVYDELIVNLNLYNVSGNTCTFFQTSDYQYGYCCGILNYIGQKENLTYTFVGGPND